MEAGTPPPAQQPQAPQVPQVEQPQTGADVQNIAELLATYRAEVAEFRRELAAKVGPRPLSVAAVETEADRAKARLETIAAHSHYCPGCGKLGDYPQKCEGSKTAGHPAIEMVSTAELNQDPSTHTAAPSSPDEGQLAA
jgi:hypothetical protein